LVEISGRLREIVIMGLTRDERRRYWADYDAILAASRADPDDWAEYRWARSAWDIARDAGKKRTGETMRDGFSGQCDLTRTGR
jgi:hypothetical protein